MSLNNMSISASRRSTARAAGPSPAVKTSYPIRRSVSTVTSSTSASSSTTSTLPDVSHRRRPSLIDRFAAGGYRQPAALRHRIARIDDEVEERGLELRRVDIGRERAGRQRHRKFDGFGAGAAEHRLEPADQTI